jgi:hypothetical protein
MQREHNFERMQTAEGTIEQERTKVRNGLIEERADVRMGKIGDWVRRVQIEEKI